MAKYRVYETVTVCVISREIEADLPIEAFIEYKAKEDYDQLLRNIIGNRNVLSVEMVKRISASVDLLTDTGDPIETVLSLDEEDIEGL